MRKLLVLCAVSLIALTGCSPAISDEVSTGCAQAMDAFGEVPADDFDAEASALTETTRACPTAIEYVAAVKANPRSWLYEKSSEVKEDLVLIGACLDNASEPMCVDAKANDLI